MARLVVTLLLCLLVVSCKSEKQESKIYEIASDGRIVLTPQNGPDVSTGLTPVNGSGEPRLDAPTELRPSASGAVPAILAQNTVTAHSTFSPQPNSKLSLEEYDQVKAAAQQLNAILDLRIDDSVNPLRMEGFVISNEDIRNGDVLKHLGENVLFGLFNDPSNDDYIRLERSWKLNRSLKVRLDTRSTITDSLKSETDRAFENLSRNLENYRDIPVPVSLRMCKNFYEKNVTEVPKAFYATIQTENGKFVGFKLTDRKLIDVGQIIMPLANAARPFDQKMIVHFKNIVLGEDKLPMSHTAVMQLTPVEVIKEKN